MSQMKDFLEDELIDGTLRNLVYTPAVTVFLGIYTVAPTDSTNGTEATLFGYARQATAFDAPAPPGETQNTALESFSPSGGGWGTITSFAMSDALAAGNQLIYGNLDTSRLVNDGDTLEFAIGALQIDFL